MVHSNLRSFLKCATPSVPSQFLPKTCIQNLSNKWLLCGDTVEYFTLADLWDCYDEWSAYGAGAPIRLNDQQAVVQYYTPYLSGIQLYTGAFGNTRNLREDSDLEYETDSASTDSEGGKLSRSNSNSSNRTWDSEDSGIDQESDVIIKERFGKLYFQYFECAGPHLRQPLKDTINNLAERYPGLNSLRSIDLSPASWMAVAWYPIYHIPAQRNTKALYSAFLTYHTLSSSYQDEIPMDKVKSANCSKEAKFREEYDSISLPSFGLAAYRMQRQVWLNPGTEDHQTFTSLLSAAASWLRQLKVDHPDFNFFVSRSM